MKIKEGDIVNIPHPNGKCFVGWVVYVSDYFKDLIGVLVYGEAPLPLTVVGSETPQFAPIYTSSKAARQYGWQIIGQRNVTSLDLKLTERVVAGEVFIGDRRMRSATQADRDGLPEMMAMGMPVVYDQLIEKPDNP